MPPPFPTAGDRGADSSDEFIAEIIDMLVDVQLDDLKSCVDQFEDILADGKRGRREGGAGVLLV